jgi:hypothetical protein
MTPEEYLQLSMTGMAPPDQQDQQPAPIVTPATPQQTGLGGLIARIAPSLGKTLSGLGSGIRNTLNPIDPNSGVDPNYAKSQQRAALLRTAAGIASGRGLGQGLANGLDAGANQYQSAMQNAYNNSMHKKQLDMAQSQQQQAHDQWVANHDLALQHLQLAQDAQKNSGIHVIEQPISDTQVQRFLVDQNNPEKGLTPLGKPYTPVSQMGTKSQLIQTVDPLTNQPVYKLIDKDTGETINPDVGTVVPKGGAAGLGGREGVMFQRVLSSANSALEALKNISELPVGASTGTFGIGASPGQSLFASAKGALTNKLAPQEVQDYNTMLAGVGRNLSTIEAAGLAPNGSLTHSMDSIQLREGDSQITKMRKLAEMRQIIIKGIETNLDNPKLPDEQKSRIKQIIEDTKTAIPFTQSDITKLQQKQNANPSYTFQDLMKEKGLGAPASQNGWSIQPVSQ